MHSQQNYLKASPNDILLQNTTNHKQAFIKVFPSLYIHPSIQYIQDGLYTNIDIVKGQVLLSIHSSDTINSNNIFQQQQIPLNNDQSLQVQLIVYLINLKSQPKFHSWLNAQSKGFIDLQKEVRNGHSMQLWIEHCAYRNKVHSTAMKVYQYMRQKQLFINYSREQFLIAFINASQFINTRSFGYSQLTTLVPYFDFINHSSTPNCYIQWGTQLNNNSQIIQFLPKVDVSSIISQPSDQQSTSSLQQEVIQRKNCYHLLIAKQNISCNTQLTISYGKRNNQQLLSWYGFVEKNNPYDDIKLYFYNGVFIFNSVQPYSETFKIKKNKFNYQLFVRIKKYLYQGYYHTQPPKIKLWTLPTSVGFQQYALNFAVKIFYESRPKCAAEQILLQYYHQQMTIYDQQTKYYQIMFQFVSSQHSIKQFQLKQSTQRNKLPKNIIQYFNLIKKLQQ